jgi:hypothetical protein
LIGSKSVETLSTEIDGSWLANGAELPRTQSAPANAARTLAPTFILE